VRLQGEIDIRSAAEFKQVLVDALAFPVGFEVDLGGATAVDITGLQLLCAAHREAGKRGVGMTLAGPLPERIAAIAREAGFTKFPWLPAAGADHADSPECPATEGAHE
jgi:anti-anti-sigma factor